MRFQIEVHVWRGSIREARHRLHLAVCDADGRLEAGSESPGMVTNSRSAAKPFQMLPLVERGHAARMGFSDLDLALMAASHSGTDSHLAVVRGILERIGCTEADLACGFHEPLDPVMMAAFHRNGSPRGALYNNCSGKHAGMLALCRAEGWPTEGYHLESHPLQQLMHRTVADLCAVPIESVPIGIDGCNLPVFALPLASMARGYARLAVARASGDARESALARIREAMTSHPWAVGGQGRFNTAVMEALPQVVAKDGAEGLVCAAWTGRGLGLALKCEDGALRALAPALILVLEQLGAVPPEALEKLAEWRRPVVRNCVGREAGRLVAELHVLAPSNG